MNGFDFEDRAIEVAIGARTDVGKVRRENQDAFLVADLTVDRGEGALVLDSLGDGAATPAHGRLTLGSKGLLALVADGMGGAAAGATASRMAANCIFNEILVGWATQRAGTPEAFAACMGAALRTANHRIRSEAAKNLEYKGMGTTATLAGVLDGFLFLGQVGDSRAYLVRKGRAVQLTKDQSLTQELVDSGMMSEEDAERSDRRNTILQALGAQSELVVDLTYQELRRGDLIVLCSDGLTRVVKPDEIARHATDSLDPRTCATQLVELACERGAPDNVTVVAVLVDGVGLDEPREDDTVERTPLGLSRTGGVSIT